MAEETVVEKTWRGILNRLPGARRGEPAVIDAAYAEPRLRALFPFPSHGALSLSPEHGVPVEQRPALHRGRRASLHRVCTPARVEARPGGVAHPA
ncbi:DUF6193 family natural product biosynthesis protein [Streptomyces sp. NPDC006906]|uniref:DUF6193 family natural product biosynthesis protein n=1 Tax=Streptomyces sp. NPDC006906 TaxID=3154782 RepID=UPI00340B76F9